MTAQETLEEFGIDTTLPPPAQVPRVATFFALYPETLGLANGTTFCIALGQRVRGFNRTAMHLAEGQPQFWLDPRLSEFLAVSVRFHRAMRDRDFYSERDDMLMSVVRAATNNSFPDFRQESSETGSEEVEAPSSYDSAAGRAYTVVEITTQLVKPADIYWQACEPNQYIMGPTLTRCIEGPLPLSS